MKEITFRNVEKTVAVILVLGSILLIVLTRDEKMLVSFALGSALMLMNLRVLRWIVEGAIRRERKKTWFLLLLPLQFGCLIALVSLLFLYGGLNAVAFLLGISTLFVSVIVTFLTPLGSHTDGT